MLSDDEGIPVADAPLTCTWNFGDGPDPVVGQAVNPIFADSGEYQATLTVTDAHEA